MPCGCALSHWHSADGWGLRRSWAWTFALSTMQRRPSASLLDYLLSVFLLAVAFGCSIPVMAAVWRQFLHVRMPSIRMWLSVCWRMGAMLCWSWVDAIRFCWTCGPGGMPPVFQCQEMPGSCSLRHRGHAILLQEALMAAAQKLLMLCSLRVSLRGHCWPGTGQWWTHTAGQVLAQLCLLHSTLSARTCMEGREQSRSTWRWPVGGAFWSWDSPTTCSRGPSGVEALIPISTSIGGSRVAAAPPRALQERRSSCRTRRREHRQRQSP
mmetsp:Transcript_60195/g.189100  ORF Transcript_60195/g.189100 Transcript_60195/m.189100 type:complete len:267 (-) Transcript_60195:3404-4204(-)